MMFTFFSLVARVTLFLLVLGLVQSCGVKTPPTPLLPSGESALDAEAKVRKKEQESAIKK